MTALFAIVVHVERKGPMHVAREAVTIAVCEHGRYVELEKLPDVVAYGLTADSAAKRVKQRITDGHRKRLKDEVDRAASEALGG